VFTSFFVIVPKASWLWKERLLLGCYCAWHEWSLLFVKHRIGCFCTYKGAETQIHSIIVWDNLTWR
jgi:hypothetical protein